MIDDDRARALGHVAEGAAKLELFLTSVLAGLVAAGQAGALVVAGESFSWTVSKIEALAKTQSGDPRCAPFLAALANARRAYERRNQILHAGWGVAVEDAAERLKWTRGSPTFMSGESMTPRDLEEVAAAIEEVIVQLLPHLEFIDAVGGDEELHRSGA